MKKIAFIPHKRRLERHRVEYLKAINEALDYPYQSEDGRDLSPIQQALHDKCAELSGIPYWTFTDCCTDALQISIHCLTKPGDTIVVPSYGWRAFANAVKFMNRTLHFVDCDETGNISIDSLEAYCKEAISPPAAVIAVHNFGTIVDCRNIRTILDNEGFVDTCIIEDAAPAFYMGEPYAYTPGSSSEAVCYSFDFTKYPGTLGSGGAIATRFEDVKERAYLSSAHGRAKSGQIITFGTKSYMDNTSCAVLLKEIQLFEQFEYRKRRDAIATWYKNNLPYPNVPGDNYVWERYTMAVSPDRVESVIKSLNDVGCLARTFFKEPLHQYEWLNDNQKWCPMTEQFTASTVMLPCHHYLKDEELERIGNALSR